MDNFKITSSVTIFLVTTIIMTSVVRGSHALKLSMLPPLSSSTSSITPENYLAERLCVIELEMPTPSEIDKMQRLKNEAILSKAIITEPIRSRYILNIVASKESNKSRILSYLADLYAYAWNEALIKKCSNFVEFIVLCDSFQDTVSCKNIATSEKSKGSIIEIYSFQLNLWLGFQANKLINTGTLIGSIDSISTKDSSLITFIDGFTENFRTFSYVAVGGTFDQLHNGHRTLLTTAAIVCDRELTIGVTSDSMLSNKQFLSKLNKFDSRRDSIEKFLGSLRPNLVLNIVALTDPFGPAIIDSQLEAIVVSSETLTGAVAINNIRTSKSMKKLHIFVIMRRDAYILSSTFIREKNAETA